ncbi:ABC-2 family transporter protein [Bacillus sp. THAF10]|uniref:ABC transporter permease n=1 Tax=Bacillus sp. THAF10 TaxID=2587848 RepID=UPI001269212A|nr:ABC-2 transporter permease [Bacillus sp. THAF10]QFT89052.1 ABC-2 family transporter protein [Bacillus sp. THAF10]
MSNERYNQTKNLLTFILKRDRVRLIIWIVSITFMTMLTASSLVGLYTNEQERQAMAETMKNPAMTAMVGKGYGLDNYTEGPMMAHQMLLFTAIVVAIMNILLVSRLTRNDEEEGRVELLRSLPVGRLANVTAVLLYVIILNTLLMLANGLGLYVMGIETIDLQGSLLYGAGLGVTGVMFAALTLLFAQLSESSRSTIGFSFSVLGIAYLIRAVGDVSNETLSWFSPLGWILATETYVNNYWWPLLIALIFSSVITLISLYLNAIRDLGSGFLPAKKGKRFASKALTSPFGLAFRLQRTGIISWAIGMFILGVSYGSVLGDLESFFSSSEMMMEMLPPIEGVSLTEQFMTMLMAIISMICTIPPLMFLLKLKGEEKKNRTEHLLARAVSRFNQLGSYLALSLILGFVMLSLSLIGLWVAADAVMIDPISLLAFLKAGLVYLPAIWVMTSIGVLTIGWKPGLTGITWAYLGYSFFVVYLGNMLKFPEWMGNLSPYGHIPNIPVDELQWQNLLILSIISLMLMTIGFIGYHRRDISG